MNKKIVGTIFVIALLAPIANSQAAVAGGVLGGTAALGLGIGLIHHHDLKKYNPGEYCNRHPYRRFCQEREQGESSVRYRPYHHHHHWQHEHDVQNEE